MELNILLVEDDLELLKQLKRDLPGIFLEKKIDVNVDAHSSFESAMAAIKNPHIRYDLVVSDTYKGQVTDDNPAVLEMVSEYRKGKFCPIVVYSSGSSPPTLKCSAFVTWADKGALNDLERAINSVLDLGIPQVAKTLHDEIDRAAGGFLWEFLEQNWDGLSKSCELNGKILERIIRKRAALILSDLTPGQYSAIDSKHGAEYYIYPALKHNYLSLGDIIKSETTEEVRVVITPHCLLKVQAGKTQPKADYVLTIKTISAKSVLGDKIDKIGGAPVEKQMKKLKSWANSPAKTEKPPEGRHWYLPKFLDIPHLYCDFLQVESVAYDDLIKEYKTIATLFPPYAEALQECFSRFYGSVGIPDIEPESIKDLVNEIVAND